MPGATEQPKRDIYVSWLIQCTCKHGIRIMQAPKPPDQQTLDLPCSWPYCSNPTTNQDQVFRESISLSNTNRPSAPPCAARGKLPCWISL